MLKKIYVPEGKQLKDKTGLYTYAGPREVIHHPKLRLEPTFTDGTKWEYIGEEQETVKEENPVKKVRKSKKN